MQIKAALSALAGAGSVRVDVPKQTAIARAAALLRLPTIKIVVPPAESMDVIADRIRHAFRQGRVPAQSDLRFAPWCLWDGSRPLELNDDVSSAYLAYVKTSGRKGAFKRLAAAYVIRFPVGARTFSAVAVMLSELAERFSGYWSSTSKSLAIFDPAEAPKRIASAARYKGLSPTEVLAEHGLSVLASESRLAEAAFVQGLRQIATERMRPLDRLKSMTQWTTTREGVLRFDQHRGLIADSLILPHDSPTPEKQERDKMLSFLLERFGDPRLPGDKWGPMKCTAIVKRWLIEQSLRQFLDVVSKTALPEQWKYRRAFWTAVYNRGLISDACVIFDELGAYHATKAFEGKTPFSRWRHVSGAKQIQKGHACLLLRIGRGVVAEWSHNGKCNVWHDATAPSAPNLHRGHYSSDEVQVKGISFESGVGKSAFTHSSPSTYSWQNKVADEIHAMTGVRIMQSEYVVR